MANSWTGRCLCGASVYAAQGPAKFTISCYCTDCQHMTGGGHLPQVGVDADGFAASGPIKTFVQKSDAGHDIGFNFCAECGSPLFKTTSKMADTVFLTAGTLADGSGLDVPVKVFETSRQPWDQS